MGNFGEYRGGPMSEEDTIEAPAAVVDAAEKRLQELGTVLTVVAPETKEVEKEELSELEEKEEISTETDEKAEETTPEVEVDETEQEQEEEQSATEELAIPENLYRAAEHNGLNAEEIVDFWKGNPKLAAKEFERMRQDTVDRNKQYCELGRVRKQMTEERAVQSEEQTTIRPKSFVDMSRAKEEFGDGAAEVIGKLDQALVQQAKELAEMKSQRATAKTQTATQQEQGYAIKTQISNFFSGDNMKAYEDFYGPSVDASGNLYPDWAHLTPGQEANRLAVTDRAADYQAGVSIRGPEVTVGEALVEAHTVVAANVKTEIIRKGIIKSVTKRAKGVTLRPAKAKVKPAAPKLKRGEKMTENKVYSKAEVRLANMLAGKPMS